VQMGINQPRNDRAALKIDHTGLWAGKPTDVRGLTHGLDLPFVDGNGFLSGELRVHSEDPAIHEDRVRDLSPRGGGEQKQNDKNSLHKNELGPEGR
jgi:hypothetical protein